MFCWYSCFLLKCKNDLKCDEEIFAEKARAFEEMQANVDHLEQENAELRGRLEAAEESVRRLEEQVLAKQIELDNTGAQLKTLTTLVGIYFWSSME